MDFLLLQFLIYARDQGVFFRPIYLQKYFLTFNNFSPKKIFNLIKSNFSSMKFRAKSVDNTDQLFSSSPKGGNNNNSNSTTADRRFKLKLLSTSPNRLSCQQQLTVNVDSNPVSGTQNVRRRLSKRPSLDSGINLSSRNETFQFFNSSHQHHHHHHHQVESEPRKPFR